MQWLRSLATCALLVTSAACSTVGGNRADRQHDMATGALLPGACEEPASLHQGQLGCYFDTAVQLRNPPRELYWHIEEFVDPAIAEGAKGPASAVVSAYDRTFLYTINGEAQFATPGGRPVSSVGPLPTPHADAITARFMQAMTKPGAMTRVHTHDGPEAFFLISGAICMDSPGGPAMTGAGQTYWIGGNVPMQLHHAGADVRRSIFLVLHPSSEPWMKMSDWKPAGGCTH
jgi:quercetin dioxygenase-like cupin family protein